MAKFIDLDTGLPALLNKVKAWVTSKLSTKQDALVSGTNIKTVNYTTLLGSGNIAIPAGSDGITPHIGSNGNWFIGDTDTTVHAQGAAGNVNINDANQLITILVNDLTTGGGGNILSAEMGKVLKTAIETLLNSIGEYAFPNGRPTLSWQGTMHNITQTLTHVTSDCALASIADDSALTVQLTADTDYVIDTVTVTMGGVDITATAYDSGTGIVTIAAVTGAVVVMATASYDQLSQYAQQEHLVFQLDGLNKGATAGKWTDLKGGVVWDNNGATELDDCWQFDGTNYLTSQNMTAHEPHTCTIEVVIDSGLTRQSYHVFTDGSLMVLNYTSQYRNQDLWISRGHTNSSGYGGLTMGNGLCDDGHGIRIVSVRGNSQLSVGGAVNGVTKNATDINYGAGTTALIGGRINSNNELNLAFTGKVYAIRIYDTFLTDAEILANQQLDNQRFNLGLSI